MREYMPGDSAGCGPADADALSAPTGPAAGRILVVAADRPVRRVLTAILTDAGYDACDAAGIADARDVLAHNPVALLLSDLGLPGESGLDLVRFARREYPQTATLLISALADPAAEQMATQFGAYRFVSKPVRRSQLLISVMTALWRRDVEARELLIRQDRAELAKLRASASPEELERLQEAAAQRRAQQEQTIHRWAQAAEFREAALGEHIRRVSRYCAVVGDKLGLDPEMLEVASMLHDAGTLAVPDEILLKPAFLTADDRLAVEAHAEVGYEMLHGSQSTVLELAAVIARTHHEKFDGTGYPHGISGDEIPLEGRIAAVADVFDALTYDRAFRPAWSVETTITWMQSERGQHFDPRVLDAFIASTREILAVRAQLPGTETGAQLPGT